MDEKVSSFAHAVDPGLLAQGLDECAAANRRSVPVRTSFAIVFALLLPVFSPPLRADEPPGRKVTPSPATTSPPPETWAESVPGTNSPTGFPDLVDATQRDFPTMKLARGEGWTRFEEGVFTVRSSADQVTYHLASSRALQEFFATADILLRAARGASGTAGLYVSRFPTAEARAGDLFFGVSSRGTVLQRHDGSAWRDLPGHGTPVAGRPRAEVVRRAGQYEVRWNGILVSSTPVGDEEAVNVLLYVSAGVEAEFGRIAVSRRP